MIVPVFKTGGWQAILSSVGSTPTRFRHLKPALLLKIYTLVPLNVLDTVLASGAWLRDAQSLRFTFGATRATADTPGRGTVLSSETALA